MVFENAIYTVLGRIAHAGCLEILLGNWKGGRLHKVLVMLQARLATPLEEKMLGNFAWELGWDCTNNVYTLGLQDCLLMWHNLW